MSSLDLEGKKNFIISNVKNLHKYEQIQIFKIFKTNNIKYSENSNGIFVNLNYLNEMILDKIIIFIKFCQKNKVLLEKEINKREQIKQIVQINQNTINFNTQIQEKYDSKDNSSVNYESGFQCQTPNETEIIENHYQEKNIVIPTL